MKLVLLLLLTLISCSNKFKTQEGYKTIQNNIYTIHYSEALEQPLFIKYDVKCYDSQNKEARKGLTFHKENGIHTSDNLDYQNNDFDKGHMAPAADFACDPSLLKKTFSFVNCALQHKSINRGVWKQLEDVERGLLRSHDKVTIEIDVIFSPNSIVLESGATVPDAFRKKIYVDGAFNSSFYIPNKDVGGTYLDEFRE